VKLVGDSALVTGGTGGIGTAISRRLAAEGCRVAVLDLDLDASAALAAELGNGSVGIQCDVRSAEGVARAVAEAVAAFGGLDIVVNNAGILGPILPIAEYGEEEFFRVIDIDLMGTYRVTHAAIPHLQAQGSGRIVNIASISGKEGNPMMAAYASAKAGVVGFTKSIGKELALSGVLVNCITPGGVNNTNIMAGLPVSDADGKVPPPPMGRFAEPDEVAAMTAWLCSDQASYSTGAVFDISGGRAMY
jgi:NAD(P)-dependent dehydrogenase (short-subunit alcohol dehydrogenase family)